jgi:hypothetical protein
MKILTTWHTVLLQQGVATVVLASDHEHDGSHLYTLIRNLQVKVTMSQGCRCLHTISQGLHQAVQLSWAFALPGPSSLAPIKYCCCPDHAKYIESHLSFPISRM